jgi:hypothetical protein
VTATSIANIGGLLSTALDAPVERGYPPRDTYPSVRVGDKNLTPRPPALPDAESAPLQRLAALARPLPPRANGFFAQQARAAYEQFSV